MSSSKSSQANTFTAPVAEFQYRQLVVALPPADSEEEELPREPEVTMTEEAFRSHLITARAQAVAETEARLRQEFEQRAVQDAARVAQAVKKFEMERKEYFSRVEAEVVQLALSIAGKILHREAQVDPMLVAALVQVALGQLKEGSLASIHVRPEELVRWQDYFLDTGLKLAVTVKPDPELVRGDCVLETEMGTVNFGLDTQLKEVERGFFDVLAQRPQL